MKKRKGLALITILMMLSVIVMLTTALITVNGNNVLYSINYQQRASALSVAESGVAYAIYALQDDASWAPSYCEKTMNTGKFIITFDKTKSYYSCNNLISLEPNTAWGGEQVYSNTVDLIVTGISGNTTKRVRVELARESIEEAGRCSGKANVNAENFMITRATTAKDTSTRGSFHSNDPNDAISTSATTNVYAYGGVISASGSINIPVYDNVANGTQLKPYDMPKQIPDIDIGQIIDDAAAKPGMTITPGGTYILRQSASGGNYALFYDNGTGEVPASIPGVTIKQGKGMLVFKDDVYFSGDVSFKFVPKDNHYKDAGIELKETGSSYPSLYVNGTNPDKAFMVYGKIEGNGAIYNKGGTKFIMETDLTANKLTGTMLLSEKNINVALPASSQKSIDLSLTGAVLTHGNFNATVLDPNNPDNPINALGGTDAWPSNWVEKAYVSGGSATVNVPPDGLQITGLPNPSTGTGTNSVLYFVPSTDDDQAFSTKDYDSLGRCNDATLNVDNGTATWSGTGLKTIHIYYRNNTGLWGCNDDTKYNWFLPGSYNLLPGDSEMHLGGWLTNHSVDGFDTTKLSSYINTHFTNYISNLSGSVATTGSDLYAPNVSITGALIVTDPNNLDGSGVYNPDAGNINVSLTAIKQNGNFTLTHSKIYEKILASSKGNTKVIVTSWEELK